MFETQIIIDIDEGQHGWEVVLRFGPEDAIAAWTDLTLDDLKNLPISETVAEAVVAEKERQS